MMPRRALLFFSLLLVEACGRPPERAVDPRPDPAPSRDSFVRHLPGLGVDAEFVSAPGGRGLPHKYIRVRGVPLSPRVVRERERAALRARYGAADPRLAEKVARLPGGAWLPVVVFVDTPVDWQRIAGTPSLAGSRLATARPLLSTALADMARRLSSVAPIRSVRTSKSMPALYLETTAAGVQSLARADGVISIASNATGRPIRTAAPNPISFLGIDTGLNSSGWYGVDEKIGFIETPHCGLYDAHERYDFNRPIVYQVEPDTCGDVGDCAECYGGFSDWMVDTTCVDLGRGLGPQCASQHVAQASSCASAARSGEPWGAAHATVHYANEGVVTGDGFRTTVCNAEAIDHSYAWLESEGVRIVSESFGCSQNDVDGVTQDWYARYLQMFVSTAGGNDGEGEGVACPWALNVMCVGSTDPSGATSSFSSFINPSGDREEPDISALGEDVETLAFGSTTDEALQAGTSFAAPAIAGFAALLRDRCDARAQDPRFLRAVLRNAAWYLNPHGEDYNTPRPGVDHRDGAGVPHSGTAAAFCGDEGPDGSQNEAGTGDFDLTSSGPVPEGHIDVPGEEPPPGDDNEPTTFGLPASGERAGQLVYTWDLAAGNRVRATVVWDSCPGSPTGYVAPASVGTDFDLFLYNVDRGEYLFWSQSFDDAVEGFDVRIPEGWDGHYELWMMHEEGVLGCDGSTFEPWAWAVTWWQ